MKKTIVPVFIGHTQNPLDKPKEIKSIQEYRQIFGEQYREQFQIAQYCNIEKSIYENEGVKYTITDQLNALPKYFLYSVINY